ncbi:MAG TPA: M24 family metallopeptidase [Pseudobdellovibrionaceae bacterium]
MSKDATETVGDHFQNDLLKFARDQSLAVILKASSYIKPGIRENEAKALIQEIQTQMGAPKSWHPPQIRFGENTLLPFGQQGHENLSLKENDIYFFDIGPIFYGHEGDVGRPFVVGNDSEMKKCCRDAASIWQEVRDHWVSTNATGKELYQVARFSAENRGWLLSLHEANGHRISDFPHAARMRGSVEKFEQKPAPNRWILEIQIRHPKKSYGAFYEDLLI